MDAALEVLYGDEATETSRVKMEFFLYSPPSSYNFACCVSDLETST